MTRTVVSEGLFLSLTSIHMTMHLFVTVNKNIPQKTSQCVEMTEILFVLASSLVTPTHLLLGSGHLHHLNFCQNSVHVI